MAEVEVARSKMLVGIVGGAIATGLIAMLVFSMGGWAYHHRGGTLHDGRLRRAVEQHPTADQITQALLAEPGMRQAPYPESDADWREFTARWPRASVPQILVKQRRWSSARMFTTKDVAYILFFDDSGT